MLIMIRFECMCCLRWWQPVAGVSGNDFWGFGNGNRKFHSQSSGARRELKKPIPNIREREGNEKIHSQNSGTGREWKNPFPKFGNGNQRPPFLGMTGNGNSRSPLISPVCWKKTLRKNIFYLWLLYRALLIVDREIYCFIFQPSRRLFSQVAYAVVYKSRLDFTLGLGGNLLQIQILLYIAFIYYRLCGLLQNFPPFHKLLQPIRLYYILLL